MVLKNDFEGRRIKDSIHNVPEHDSVKDRVMWHTMEDMRDRYGYWLKSDLAEEIVDAFIASKRSDWPSIDKSMAKGPCTKYDDHGAGRYMHVVMPFAVDYLRDEKGIELKKLDRTTYGIG